MRRLSDGCLVTQYTALLSFFERSFRIDFYYLLLQPLNLIHDSAPCPFFLFIRFFATMARGVIYHLIAHTTTRRNFLLAFLILTTLSSNPHLQNKINAYPMRKHESDALHGSENKQCVW
jgi:hypothetical protein